MKRRHGYDIRYAEMGFWLKRDWAQARKSKDRFFLVWVAEMLEKFKHFKSIECDFFQNRKEKFGFSYILLSSLQLFLTIHIQLNVFLFQIKKIFGTIMGKSWIVPFQICHSKFCWWFCIFKMMKKSAPTYYILMDFPKQNGFWFAQQTIERFFPTFYFCSFPCAIFF